MSHFLLTSALDIDAIGKAVLQTFYEYLLKQAASPTQTLYDPRLEAHRQQKEVYITLEHATSCCKKMF